MAPSSLLQLTVRVTNQTATLVLLLTHCHLLVGEAANSSDDSLARLLPLKVFMLSFLTFQFFPLLASWLTSYALLKKSKYTLVKARQDLESNSSALATSKEERLLFQTQSQSGVSRPSWRLLFRAHCWRWTCIGLDGSCDFIFSEESDLFLQFVLLPLSKVIKGRHGHAKDSEELLW